MSKPNSTAKEIANSVKEILPKLNDDVLKLYATDCAEYTLWRATKKPVDVHQALWLLLDLYRAFALHELDQKSLNERIRREPVIKRWLNAMVTLNAHPPHELSVYHCCAGLYPDNAQMQALLTFGHAIDESNPDQWFLDRLHMWHGVQAMTQRYWMVYNQQMDLPVTIVPIWKEFEPCPLPHIPLDLSTNEVIDQMSPSQLLPSHEIKKDKP